MTRTPSHLRSRVARRLTAGAAALIAATLTVFTSAAPAAAGGGVLSQAGDLDVTSQRTIASYVDGQVQLLVDFDLTGEIIDTSDPDEVAAAEAAEAAGTTGAVLIIATPAEPVITQAGPEDEAALAAFDAASSPTLIEEDQWWPDGDYFAGTEAGGAETLPVATFAPDGTNSLGVPGADAVLAWLASVGYTLDADDTAPIVTYANGGWWITVLTITPVEEGGEMTLPLLRITFPSPDLVVPMLLAASSDDDYTIRTTVVAAERMDRTDLLRGMSTVEFAGPVDSLVQPDAEAWLSPYGGTAWLTTVSQTFTDPSRINQDIRFAPSTFGPVSAGSVVQMQRRIIWGLPAGLVLVGGGMILVALGGIALSVWLQRRHAD